MMPGDIWQIQRNEQDFLLIVVETAAASDVDPEERSNLEHNFLAFLLCAEHRCQGVKLCVMAVPRT